MRTASAEKRRSVVVASLEEAVEAAREVAKTSSEEVLWLVSPPGAAAFWGAGYLPALLAEVHAAVPGVDVKGALDAADDAGYAQAAIRAGVAAVIFTGPADVARRLADIAGQAGAELWKERPEGDV